jgi:transaldolase
LPVDSGDAETVLAQFTERGVDRAALADLLQREGTVAFDKSWRELMKCLAEKSAMLKKVNQAGAGQP